MLSDRAEIENVLERGREILENRPELTNMSLKDVIDDLYDIIHERWGVTAWLVVNSIENWDLTCLVEHLASVESGVLTYEYAGYLLQSKYDVDLESLLIMADEQGKFENIAKYVSSNLRFMPEVKQQNIEPLLHMLEKHIDSGDYFGIVSNYANGIANCKAYKSVADFVGEISSKPQYDLMHRMCKDWYQYSPVEASEMIERLIRFSTVWGRRAAIDYLKTVLDYDVAVFEGYFSHIENMICEEDLWLWIIPVFVKYIIINDKSGLCNELDVRVMAHLRKIPTDGVNAKRCFLEAIEWEENLSERLVEIFQSIILMPFDNGKIPFDLLDYPLQRQARNGAWENALQTMMTLFAANKQCHLDYEVFFDELSGTAGELLKYSSEVTARALQYMLASDEASLFFGLGLLISVGDIQKLKNEMKESAFADAQLVRLMKTVLYFSFESKTVCRMAFQLLLLLDGSPERYFAFCMDEVYGNYSRTISETAKQYLKIGTDVQRNLAQVVVETYDKDCLEYRQGAEIKDLQSPWEQTLAYRRAMKEQSNQINKSAMEQSIISKLFGTRILKYGVRSAHIVIGEKGEKRYGHSDL